jgi:hypothetical protein
MLSVVDGPKAVLTHAALLGNRLTVGRDSAATLNRPLTFRKSKRIEYLTF